MIRATVTIILLAVALTACDSDDRAGTSPEIKQLNITSTEAPGEKCAAGGHRIQSGMDHNQNKRLDDVEVQQIRYACSLTTTVPEPAGDYCVVGGVRIISGLDTNTNAVLDDTEITNTEYVCSLGSSLISTTPEPPGENCASGGSRIDSGIDTNADNVLASDEIQLTSYLCNNPSHLVNTSDEPDGANCMAGGVRIETGPDINANAQLEPDEVLHTQFICNPEAPPSTPLVIAASSVKRVNFTWTDIIGATHYRLLENIDGQSGYSLLESFNNAVQNYEYALPLFDRLNAHYILQACNSYGCSDSEALAIEDVLNEAIGYFKASNPNGTETCPITTGDMSDPCLFDRGDQFGYAVALSNDGLTLAISAPGEESASSGINGDQTDNSLNESGAVYIYSRSTDQWQLQAYIKASNPDMDDYFGHKISLSGDGDTLAVGAYLEDSSAKEINGNQSDNSARESGAVYIFKRHESIWEQVAYLKSSNAEAHDVFGSSLSLNSNGDVLAVSARGEDSAATTVGGDQTDNSLTASGAVYIFRHTDNAWLQTDYIKSNTTRTLEHFGETLSLSGDGSTLAVGHRENEAGYIGAVSVFVYNESTWSEQETLYARYSEVLDRFAEINLALSHDGNTLAVGARFEESIATGINGDEADNSGIDTGAAYVFEREGNRWFQQAYIKASNPDNRDLFGWSVALSSDGHTLAVSAMLEDSSSSGLHGNETDNLSPESGAVYVYKREASNWHQSAYVKAPNTEAGDEFGWRVHLSGDGSALAVSALRESSNASGIGGNKEDNSKVNSGAVYLY